MLSYTCALLAACGGGAATSSENDPAVTAALDGQLRGLLRQNGIAAPARPAASDALYSLGLNLFQSPLLSGNRSVSCASCHPIGNAGLDNLALGIGINGTGSPPNRTGTPLLHRNTPSLINATVGERQFMFWDGRVAIHAGVLTTPAGDKLPAGLNGVVAAQALFPLLSRNEMLGNNLPGDSNELADLNAQDAVVEADPLPVWNGIMARLRADTVFAPLLHAAYPDVPITQLDISVVGNALAAYQARRWYNFGSTNALLAYLGGSRDINDSAKRGGVLFYSKATCVQCHAGPLLTDQQFHNLAVPQLGPGFGQGAAQTPPRDTGRFGITGQAADLYAFLTPSLWEVKNTFPYFHNGAAATLEQAVRHHLGAASLSMAFRCADAPRVNGVAVPCRDSTTAPALYQDMAAHLSPGIQALPALSDAEVADLIAFLNVLTDGNNNSVR